MLSYRDYGKDELIGVDIESKDPFLKEKGPGVYRKDGYVLGCSLSNGEISEYYPLQHYDTTPQEREKNLGYLKDQLGKNNRKVFANGLYDLDWLENYEGIKVSGRFEDVQIAEPLLDEYKRSYSLDSLSKEYLKECKGYKNIYDQVFKDHPEVKKESDIRKILWKLPQDLVAEYAQNDPNLTVRVFREQEKKLNAQDLKGVYDLEMSLYPLLLLMRKTGVRLDENRLTQLGLELSDVRCELQEKLNQNLDAEINVNSANDLVKIFDKYDLPITYGEPTPKMMENGIYRGNPTFDKRVLSRIDHPIIKDVKAIRHLTTLFSLFLIPYPDLVVSGRLHCQFNQLRGDEYGTVSGRFSSSNPNLQQVSARNEEDYSDSDNPLISGQAIRKLFLPEEGCFWLKDDYSQVEYRLISHFAIGEGADTIRSRYRDDPKTDYHHEMGLMAGIEDRKIVKTLNFGAAYGMGPNTMADIYGWDKLTARSIYDRYHKKLPFIRETANRVAAKAKRVGYIRTILGRRARLVDQDKSYVMFNRLIQGSAADIMKKAMSDSYRAGIFNVLHPHLTVHDEKDVSVPRTKAGLEAAKELQNILENCVKLRVPLIVDCQIGDSWGELSIVEDWNKIT